MKKSTLYLLPLLAALPLQALTVETRPTHGVFYAGVEKQACLQVKLIADAADVGKTISAISFTSGKTTKPADVTKARLYSTKDNVFSLNAVNVDYLATQKQEGSISSGKVTFSPNLEITAAGTSYLWLAYDIAATAKGNNKIDAVCTEVKLGTESIKPTAKLGTHVKKRVYGTVYPFKNRIVPYYRTDWIHGWAATPLNATHFKSFTDIIHFGFSFTSEGEVTYQWYWPGPMEISGAKTQAEHADLALEKLKKLRGTAKSRIIAGFGHFHDQNTGTGPFMQFYQNNTDRNARKAIAQKTAKYLLENGYDGIDLDWEYPNEDNHWNWMVLMLADLRDELAGSGLSVSIAATLWYKQPIIAVTDQVDFINTMSYDQVRVDQHSPMSILQSDAQRCSDTLKMPKSKVVLGLPFYTNIRDGLWAQAGWVNVVNAYPNLAPSVNNAILTVQLDSGPLTTMHSFNGVNLIKEKCKWVKENGYGGVMIWAYDTDVSLTHKMSLGKALYSVLKQTRR